MSKLWLIIWRFQPLHIGHLLLIEKSLQDNPATLVLIWSSQICNADNPYSYELRKKFFTRELSEEKISYWALPDFPDDIKWKDFIFKYIPETISEINIYCWDRKNDSAIASLLRLQDSIPIKLNIIEIPRSIIPISATQIRSWIKEKQYEKLRKYIPSSVMHALKI